VGLDVADDAAVYRLDEGQALVQTVDFFPPIVDDPYTFGAIAAANSLSDIYAMGGTPILALNIAGWPGNLPLDMLAQIFRGGMDKVEEAGAVIGGGHTVMDQEPKYGLCVTGLIHPEKITTKGAVKPGDLLVLTKPLGTGVITTALKSGKVRDVDIQAAVDSMLRLNKVASELAVELGIRAMTDITGYGLLGHAFEMSEASNVCLNIELSKLPVLPGALDYIRQDIYPGGLNRNRSYLTGEQDGRKKISYDNSIIVDENLVKLAMDPQTSGGLLIAVPQEQADEFTVRAEQRGQSIWIIGFASEGYGVRLLP